MPAEDRDKNRRTKALIKHPHAMMEVTRVSEVKKVPSQTERQKRHGRLERGQAGGILWEIERRPMCVSLLGGKSFNVDHLAPDWLL